MGCRGTRPSESARACSECLGRPYCDAWEPVRQGDGEPPSKRGTGELVADHVKYWPLFRMWVCQWCNVHFTWIFDTFPDAHTKFKKAVKMAFISLADMNSAV